MLCPKCGAKTKVENSIPGKGRDVRQRYCESQLCGLTFQTAEIVIGPPDVVALSLPRNPEVQREAAELAAGE